MNPLISVIPAPLVRFFARPYVAGDSLDAAVEVVAGLLDRGVLSTLDLLAETIERREQAEENLATYLEMVDRVASDPRFAGDGRRPTVSLKLSSYTTEPLDEPGGTARGSAEAAATIAAAAAERGVGLTLDMESRHWTDFTLDLLRSLHARGHTHVGCVLQTRLHRTETDLARLPDGARTRLVIGIYREPSGVALTDKEEMKRRLVRYALQLLERGHFVEVATHDERHVRAFVAEALPRFGADRFEVQLLYGVPRQRLVDELLGQGCTVRLYVPFALSWPQAIAYLRRRLDEFPAMMWLVAKNWLSRR